MDYHTTLLIYIFKNARTAPVIVTTGEEKLLIQDFQM